MQVQPGWVINDTKMTQITRRMAEASKAKPTIKHQNLLRAAIRLRKADGEARRANDPSILEDAQVQELMRIIGR